MSGGRTIITPISIHAPRAGCDSTAQAGFVGWINFNPRTPCGVRREGIRYEKADGEISIHAPRAGCDRVCAGGVSERFDFNPRTPCGVRRAMCAMVALSHSFQSTHPVRGATTPLKVNHGASRFQSTHPVRGATLEFCGNIHAINFNPRTPCGVRLEKSGYHGADTDISIHAPRAGCDDDAGGLPKTVHHFNPRTPCGVRPALPFAPDP